MRPVWLNEVEAMGPPLFSKAVGEVDEGQCPWRQDDRQVAPCGGSATRRNAMAAIRLTLEPRLALLVPEVDSPVASSRRERPVRVELDVVDRVDGRRL